MSESVDEGEHDEQSARPRKIYITLPGAMRLREELQRLLNVERPKVTAEVSAAAAQGDRSENAEYIYGKRRLREIDRRLHFLKKRLDNAVVVDPQEQRDLTAVFFGAMVTLENSDDQTRVTYQIVGPDEIDVKTGRISVDSPVGRSLLGKKKNDFVTVMRPKGEVEFQIIDIRRPK